eukprot:SAG31_NODE_957_length_10768_cov_3.322992_12_plen_86_part_00
MGQCIEVVVRIVGVGDIRYYISEENRNVKILNILCTEVKLDLPTISPRSSSAALRFSFWVGCEAIRWQGCRLGIWCRLRMGPSPC